MTKKFEKDTMITTPTTTTATTTSSPLYIHEEEIRRREVMSSLSTTRYRNLQRKHYDNPDLESLGTMNITGVNNSSIVGNTNVITKNANVNNAPLDNILQLQEDVNDLHEKLLQLRKSRQERRRKRQDDEERPQKQYRHGNKVANDVLSCSIASANNHGSIVVDDEPIKDRCPNYPSDQSWWQGDDSLHLTRDRVPIRSSNKIFELCQEQMDKKRRLTNGKNDDDYDSDDDDDDDSTTASFCYGAATGEEIKVYNHFHVGSNHGEANHDHRDDKQDDEDFEIPLRKL